MEKNDTKIRINYIGWDSKYDETLDLVTNADRISAFGTKSTEQTSIYLAHKSPEKRRTFQSYFMRSVEQSNKVVGSSSLDSDKLNIRKSSASYDSETGKYGASLDEAGDTADEHGTKISSKETVRRKSIKGIAQLGEMMTKAITKLKPIGNSSSFDEQQSPEVQEDTGDGTGKSDNTQCDTDASNDDKTSGRSKAKGTLGGTIGEDGTYYYPDGITAEEVAAFEKEINKEKVFLSSLEAQGLHVIEIVADGNCLFRALSHQLYLNEDHHEELRKDCITHLRKHKRRYEMFVTNENFEAYLEDMSKLGVWADDLEIRAMEEILDRNILIYSSNSYSPKELVQPVNENPDEAKLMKGVVPINLSYHGQSHYNSIYNDRSPLPLAVRASKVLLNTRVALFDGKGLTPMKTSVNNQTTPSPHSGNNGQPTPTSAAFQSIINQQAAYYNQTHKSELGHSVNQTISNSRTRSSSNGENHDGSKQQHINPGELRDAIAASRRDVEKQRLSMNHQYPHAQQQHTQATPNAQNRQSSSNHRGSANYSMHSPGGHATNSPYAYGPGSHMSMPMPMPIMYSPHPHGPIYLAGAPNAPISSQNNPHYMGLPPVHFASHSPAGMGNPLSSQQGYGYQQQQPPQRAASARYSSSNGIQRPSKPQH